MAAQITKYVAGTRVALLTTELNSLATAGRAISSVTNSGIFDNTLGGAQGDGYTMADAELLLAAYTGTPTANTGFDVYFLTTQDGANYEDGDASTTPARRPNLVIPVRAVASGPQRIIIPPFVLPYGKFKTLIVSSIGLTIASSGNTLYLRPLTLEFV